MSTFNGIVEEFPQIRIDYFRKSPENPPPLACFLSHVHSDHLQGLESLRAPFVYCSAATREILLRIEKYPHRMNFSKGILESRKQHYKHLAKLLRPLPLNVPTEIELMPRCHIRVTLFDANHCPGAVMFLIEGSGKAVLYTGDIRAEPWWVDSITRNPVLIPYTLGGKRLDRIYLDTTFAIRSDVYRTFPSKAEGIRELLETLQKYPEDTTFYLRAWTFGYEDVWLALSAALNTQIHVDRYQMGLYKSLAKGNNTGFGIDEAPFLCGFTLGNSKIPGCLTDDENVRVHSCEPGMFCSKISKSPSVFITPIVTRTNEGIEVAEVGAGGGKGDLSQSHDLELSDEATLQQLAAFCAEQIQDEEARSMAVAALLEAYKSKSKTLSLDEYGIKEEDEISIRRFIDLLARDGRKVEGPFKDAFSDTNARRSKTGKGDTSRSRMVTFPYSRHSSYAELCGLVEAFKPKDIYPCTVDMEKWNEDVSIRSLFGHLCSGTEFAHDDAMREALQGDEYRPRKRAKRASESSSIAAVSTQRSGYDVVSVEHSDTLAPLITTEMRTSPLGEPVEVAGSQIQAENHAASSTHEDVDNLSQSTNPRVKAIRAALKQKRRDNELDFHLSSSFSSELDPQATSQISFLSKPEEEHLQYEHDDNKVKNHNSQLPEGSHGDLPSQTTYVNDTNDTQPDVDDESTLTLSPSAFDSQHSTIEQQQQEQQQQHATDHHRDNVNFDGAAPSQIISISSSSASSESLPALTTPAQPLAPATLQRRDSRMTAYRAARDGSYEAWSSFCTPVSAGNNHTEEDVEL